MKSFLFFFNVIIVSKEFAFVNKIQYVSCNASVDDDGRRMKRLAPFFVDFQNVKSCEVFLAAGFVFVFRCLSTHDLRKEEKTEKTMNEMR